jgi:hypothetical protein
MQRICMLMLSFQTCGESTTLGSLVAVNGVSLFARTAVSVNTGNVSRTISPLHASSEKPIARSGETESRRFGRNTVGLGISDAAVQILLPARHECGGPAIVMMAA